jgi:hypothetical protein
MDTRAKFEDQPEPYSIFTRKEKWFIVGLTSFAGLFRQETLIHMFGIDASLQVACVRHTAR